jgi:hypothetical protein
MSAWVVQEGRWGYVRHFPKIWCGGIEWEVRKTHCSEGDKKRKWMEKEKNKDPAKFGVRKKTIKFGHSGARGGRPLSPSRLSLRPALWTTSTSGKVLDV